jgi:hypothetical protein
LQCRRLLGVGEQSGSRGRLKASHAKQFLPDRGDPEEDVVRLLRSNLARPTRSWFGDAVILLFLLAQTADGVCTYVGLSMFGVHLEANPLLLALITTFGLGTGIASAKIFAALLGVSLHRVGVHGILAGLTGLYVFVALLPWASIFLMH